MRLSCSSWSYHRALEAGRWTVTEWIALCARQLGLEGVEIEDKHLPATAAGLREVRRAVEDEGLALANVTTFNDFGHEDEASNRAELDRVQRWIDRALALGSPSLRVFAGWPRGEREAAWARMLDWLGQAVAYAEAQGLTLVLENHNHGGFIRTSADTERVLRALPSPRLRPLLDTGNYLDGWASIERVLPQAAHVHAKLLRLDAQGREVNIDHARVLAELHRVGYRGFVSAEYEGAEEEAAAVPRGLRYLRARLDDVLSQISEGA